MICVYSFHFYHTAKLGYSLYTDEGTTSGKLSNLIKVTENNKVAEAGRERVCHAQGVFEIYNMVDTDDAGGSLVGDEPNQISEFISSQKKCT